MYVVRQSLGRNIKGYDLAGEPRNEHVLVIALTQACVPELRSKLEMSGREDVVAYIERRHSSIRPARMDIGSHEEEEERDDDAPEFHIC